MPFEIGNTEGSKKGPHKKSKQWEELSKVMIDDWAGEVKDYGNQLLLDGKHKEFTNLFLDLLDYFKPKMRSTELKGDSAIHIKVNIPDE